MLDNVTKKRIDDLRNILVGKIPSPQSQVEQITTGLIYKFMYDMDNEAIEMGGIPSFFVKEFEQYSWKNLFNPKLLGVQRVKLYSEAIENLYNNPYAPATFREIFKNSFLPFKDASTLNMFLKEINKFNYSNSEQLGDAYEYLLSFMGSQGDAGQFRTPRHIIDFIVEIINPQKNETILDPACGSSGFLISSYKHILNQNSHTRIGDQLNASERKKIGDNLVGYDIDPAMTRISSVNMYLHNFASPNISEYDTLSSEEKWNEYFDVILANPPFFSPTGGIKPHSRFGVKSTRAEVLFVDYIMEHLRPKGRAGIIVPEGIIFQTGAAYKILRKKLIEDSLVGVISLPAGVFQPYSGVKTSILILDKEVNQKSESIFFAKVENDGFSLGSQRSPITKNDLPDVIKLIVERDFNDERLIEVTKNIILGSSDISFSFSKYKETFTSNFTNFDFVKLGDLVEIQSGAREKGGAKTRGIASIGGGQIDLNGKIKSEKMVYISEDFFEKLNKGKLEYGDVLIVKDGATTGKIGLFKQEYKKASINEHVFLLRCNQKIINKFLFHILRTPIFEKSLAPYIQGIIGGINLSIKEIKIPLPPIEFQQEIVNEIEDYQKIIDGCRQVVDNYKPSIEIDPSWETVSFHDAPIEIIDGDRGKNYPTSIDFSEKGDCLFLNTKNVRPDGFDFSETKFITKEKDEQLRKGKLQRYDVILTTRGTVGNTAYFGVDVQYESLRINSGMLIFRCLPEKINGEYLFYFFQSKNCIDQFKKLMSGSAQPQLPISSLKNALIPTPSLEEQRAIIKKIKSEKEVVDGNRKLIQIYTQKIQNKINKVWGY